MLYTDMIEELISMGQQVDAVHFTFEVGLEDKFPPVPLLKDFLKDAKKAAASLLEGPNNSGRAAVLIYICNFALGVAVHGYVLCSVDLSMVYAV